jgi:hypothetical protein
MRQELHAIAQDFDLPHGTKAIDTVRKKNHIRPKQKI